ncbi:MAG: hypothetical protein ACXABO_20640 [Promethearchaeota archaeon]|jgi:hypothetical protein
MGITFKFYKPDNDYEQIQADLYNNAIGKYGTPGNATAEQIKERYRVEGFDNKGVQYAFDDDKPIAYIQTRKVVETKQVYIGYPWSTTDCPEEVKDQMFKNMVNYLYKRDPEYKLVCGVIQDSWTDVREFLEKYNCTVENEYKTYLLDITSLSKLDNSGYTSKIGTSDDEEALFELCMSEPGFSDTFQNEEAVKNFVKDALKELETIFIYKNDDLVSAGAVFSYEPDRNNIINTRFTATAEYKFEYWKAYVIEIAKRLIEKGLKGMKFTLFDRQPKHLEFYDKYSSGSRTGFTYIVPKL